MDLYILRHGLAGSRTEWTGPDAERPLTSKGRSRSRAAARGLAALGVAPDVILTSPYLRAAETAQLTAGVLGAPVVEVQELEPGKLQHGYRLLLQQHAEGAAAMLVGHEPDLSALIGMLIAGSANTRIGLKKGACALLQLDAAELTAKVSVKAPVATLVWLLTARALSAIGHGEKKTGRA
jgi:phosphohistidine phosphatase